MKAADNRVTVEEGRHSSRGASSSTRWRNCAGSNNLIDKLMAEGSIKKMTNRAAAEGTAAHLVVASCLEDGSDAIEMKDIEIEVGDWIFPVDNEMVAGVQETVDWVRNRISKAKADGFEVKLYIEKGLESFTDEDAYGTPDVVIHIIGDRLIVVDFKYGRGISVEPTSDQNYYYGYLGVENYLDDPDAVKVVESWIAQPRIPHPDGTIRRHITNAAELTTWWFNELLPDMLATREKDAELVIGEHCRFCPAKGHCPALKNEVFEFPMGISPSHLSDDELGDILKKLAAIKAVQTTFEAEALRRARGGDKIPGYKLVRKMGNREWKTQQAIRDPDTGEMEQIAFDDAVIAEFGVDAYTDPKIRSPAQIEKLPGGSNFASLWAFKPDNGLTLAKNDDKRMEVRPNIERFRGVRQPT
jgi:hypothetical protein